MRNLVVFLVGCWMGYLVRRKWRKRSQMASRWSMVEEEEVT